jgi:hypothetical protein
MMLARQGVSSMCRQLKGHSNNSDPRMKQFESKLPVSFMLPHMNLVHIIILCEGLAYFIRVCMLLNFLLSHQLCSDCLA